MTRIDGHRALICRVASIPSHFRHVHVHDNHLGTQEPGQFHLLFLIRCLSDHRHIAIDFQKGFVFADTIA